MNQVENRYIIFVNHHSLDSPEWYQKKFLTDKQYVVDYTLSVSLDYMFHSLRAFHAAMRITRFFKWIRHQKALHKVAILQAAQAIDADTAKVIAEMVLQPKKYKTWVICVKRADANMRHVFNNHALLYRITLQRTNNVPPDCKVYGNPMQNWSYAYNKLSKAVCMYMIEYGPNRARGAELADTRVYTLRDLSRLGMLFNRHVPEHYRVNRDAIRDYLAQFG